MSDLLTSIVRTVTSKLVGGLIGLALALVVVVPDDLSRNLTLVVTAAVTVAAQVVYYVAARLLERRFPGVGGLLLGAAKAPTYDDGGLRPVPMPRP